MARLRDRIAENVDGDFYVDHSCIDCDLCRQIAPDVYARSAAKAQSYVQAQPADPHRALMALVACPTSSIGTTRKLDSKAAARTFPEPLADGVADVMFCGFASEASFGAAAWLVRRRDGNVLIDSPRFASTLVERIAELGGVRWMFLTHRDDVADHRQYAKRFGCERVLHRADVTRDTADVERLIDGPIALADDLRIVPVPGHSRGSCVLIYRDTFAFTGDHVWASERDDAGGLEAGHEVSWYSWPEQKRSMAALAEHHFTWVLPGHGRRFHAASADAMRAALLRLAATM